MTLKSPLRRHGGAVAGSTSFLLRLSKQDVDGRDKPGHDDAEQRTNMSGIRPDGMTAMARMIVVYKTPKDPAAFDRHYFDTHVPLAKKLPGLRKYEVSRGPIALLNNAADTYLVSALYFDSLSAIRAAFATPVGQACAADRKLMAPDEDVQTFLFDIREV